MPAATNSTDAWSEECATLWHGIPCRLAVLGASDALREACWALLHQADAVFNRYQHTSELARLNAAEDPETHPLSPLLVRGLQAAQEAHRISRGACNAAAGALIRLWRAAVDRQRWPSTVDLDLARAQAGWAGLTLCTDRLQLHRDQRTPHGGLSGGGLLDLDLGGVVKGLLVDLIDDRLVAAGISSALIQIGGETSCRGLSPRGSPWRIGIQHPVLASRVWSVIEAPASGLSCSTSGDYRRDRAIGDRPVPHLIDPISGQPADPCMLSATVATGTAGRAASMEALTKAAYLLPAAAASGAVEEAAAEMLVLRAVPEGVEEFITAGWSQLEPT